MAQAHPSDSAEPLARMSTTSDGTPQQTNEAEKGEEKATPAGFAKGLPQRWKFYAGIAAATIVVVILAIVLPVYFTVIKPKSDAEGGNSDGSNGGDPSVPSPTETEPPPPPPVVSPPTPFVGLLILIWLGLTVRLRWFASDDGEWDHVYIQKRLRRLLCVFPLYRLFSALLFNLLVGVTDAGNPFNNDARPNSWTPALNTTWKWGVNRVNGVNLGGWFVLEPFITPAIFQRYPGAEDEYDVTRMMRERGTLHELEEHYDTFIVRIFSCCAISVDKCGISGS